MTEQQLHVRDAVAGDVGAMAESMSRAFFDDPLVSWVMPDEGLRMQTQRRVYTTMFADLVSARYGELYTPSDGVAAAIWMRPGKPKPPLPATLRLAAVLLRHRRGVRVARYASAMQALQKRHPKPRHWYLAGIGTDPAFQGRGIATALMQPALRRCDAERVPAYLETQKEDNVGFYERRGFRVTGELDLPKGGPHMWLMWRDPA